MLPELLEELRPRQGPLVADEIGPDGLHEGGGAHHRGFAGTAPGAGGASGSTVGIEQYRAEPAVAVNDPVGSSVCCLQ